MSGLEFERWPSGVGFVLDLTSTEQKKERFATLGTLRRLFRRCRLLSEVHECVDQGNKSTRCNGSHERKNPTQDFTMRSSTVIGHCHGAARYWSSLPAGTARPRLSEANYRTRPYTAMHGCTPLSHMRARSWLTGVCVHALRHGSSTTGARRPCTGGAPRGGSLPGPGVRSWSGAWLAPRRSVLRASNCFPRCTGTCTGGTGGTPPRPPAPPSHLGGDGGGGDSPRMAYAAAWNSASSRAAVARSSRRCRRRNKGTFHRLLPVASKRLFELWSIAPEMNLESAPDLRPPVEPWVRRTTWVGRAWDEGATEPG